MFYRTDDDINVLLHMSLRFVFLALCYSVSASLFKNYKIDRNISNIPSGAGAKKAFEEYGRSLVFFFDVFSMIGTCSWIFQKGFNSFLYYRVPTIF